MTKKIATVLLATMTLAGCISEQRGAKDALPVGAPMPAFSVSGPDGTVTNADLAGVRTVVALFRTTCPDCSREMPNVETAFKRVGGSGVRFIAISKEDNATVEVPKYWAETGMTMPYYFDPEGAAFTAFDVHFVPTLYLFGSDGKVAYAAVETFDFSADELVKLIEDLK
jgi:peroxiredoxin